MQSREFVLDGLAKRVRAREDTGSGESNPSLYLFPLNSFHVFELGKASNYAIGHLLIAWNWSDLNLIVTADGFNDVEGDVSLNGLTFALDRRFPAVNSFLVFLFALDRIIHGGANLCEMETKGVQRKRAQKMVW